MSYAAACAKNLRKDHVHIPLPCPPSFNLQRAQTAKAAQPIHKEEPKVLLLTIKTKENLQLLLKPHINGLSIFQLKKLYLVQFQQPLVLMGLPLKTLLKDIAKVKGIGVQMKVYPILVDDPSSSSNSNRNLTPRGTSALNAQVGNEVLNSYIKKSGENLNNYIPTPPSEHKPSSSGSSNTNVIGEYNSVLESGDTGVKQSVHQRQNQPMTENSVKNVAAISHTANNHFAWASQVNQMNESPDPAGNDRDNIDTQWPPLPQKFIILKEIKERAKEPTHLRAQILNNKPWFKQKPSANVQLQENTQEPQASDLAPPLLHPHFSFVMEETGFSFVIKDTNVGMEYKSLEKN